MRTLDDIVPPSRRKETPQVLEEERAMNAPLRPRAPRRRFPYGTALIALIIVLGAFGAIWYFSGAEVQVTPNVSNIAASGTYTAMASGADLSFRIVTADKIATQTVAASGTQNVTSVATGVITISNSQSVAQKLIATTRFETQAGLVFHIKNAVTIPAHGSVNAAVYADQPGAAYNIGPSSFTVPGLANTPQYTSVTGKSAAAMSGGASGTQPVVDPTTLASTRTALQAALAPDLVNQLAAAVPAGYVIVPGSATTTYQDIAPTASSGTGSADVKEEGTATAVALPNAALAKALALQVQGASYTGEPVTIVDPTSLTITPTAGFPGSSDQTFTFTLGGTAQLLSTIDPNQIASAVAGKTRTAAEVALTNYPSVKQAVLILRPFWKSAFPEDPAKIKVIVEDAQ